MKFNIETKVEAGAPEQTAPREQFVDVAIREIQKAAHMEHRVSIQSFDWGALRLSGERPRAGDRCVDGQGPAGGRPARQHHPGLAVSTSTTSGGTWSGAASIGVDAISPMHGKPQKGK